MKVSFILNGSPVSADVPADMSLLDILRDVFHLTGAKRSCEEGACGACTVIVDGEAVSSCIYPAGKTEGKNVLTIEGLSTGGRPDPLQTAFIEMHAIQCGFCTPGMIMAAKALLMKEPDPDEKMIREALSGNICRCTGYDNIIKAVKAAAKVYRENRMKADENNRDTAGRKE